MLNSGPRCSPRARAGVEAFVPLRLTLDDKTSSSMSCAIWLHGSDVVQSSVPAHVHMLVLSTQTWHRAGRRNKSVVCHEKKCGTVLAVANINPQLSKQVLGQIVTVIADSFLPWS